MKTFTVIVERDADGYYVASVPGLHGCHTQAESLDELQENIKEAIELCLEEEGENYIPEQLLFVQSVSIQ